MAAVGHKVMPCADAVDRLEPALRVLSNSRSLAVAGDCPRVLGAGPSLLSVAAGQLVYSLSDRCRTEPVGGHEHGVLAIVHVVAPAYSDLDEAALLIERSRRPI